jgi:hypothetical protein
MQLHTDEESVMSRITLPEHFSGWGRVVHGGILSTLLDEILEPLFKQIPGNHD